MCIRDRCYGAYVLNKATKDIETWIAKATIVATGGAGQIYRCLLYTSDAADERSSVDLGGRRIIKKKKNTNHRDPRIYHTISKKSTNEKQSRMRTQR